MTDQPVGKYVPPKYGADAFNCSRCGAYAHQDWTLVVRSGGRELIGLSVSYCYHCKEHTVWIGERILYPPTSTAPSPSSDMPADVRADYDEAAQVLQQSPRAAAALLRLAIQKLCVHLEQPGKTLDHDIGALVKAELGVEIQQALDIVRVVGNNAVHPGELDLRDDYDTCASLFELVNMIVDDRISQPKRVAELFEKLPPGAKEHIEEQDS